MLSRDQSTITLDTSLSELPEDGHHQLAEKSVEAKKGMKKYPAVIRLANHSSYSNLSSMDTESLASFNLEDDDLRSNRSHSTRTIDSTPSSGTATIDRSLSSRSKRQQRDRLLLHGVKQFNLDAKNGLEYLSKSGILNKTSAKEVSLFVYCLFV